jgi:hypothetical protein
VFSFSKFQLRTKKLRKPNRKRERGREHSRTYC